MKNIYSVVSGILRSGDCVLCGKRGKGFFESKWEFPGGKIEPGESKEEALRREIQEETGCIFTEYRFYLASEVEYEDFIIHMESYLIDYNGSPPKALVHQELRWVPLNKLLELDWCDVDRIVVNHLIS